MNLSWQFSITMYRSDYLEASADLRTQQDSAYGSHTITHGKRKEMFLKLLI